MYDYGYGYTDINTTSSILAGFAAIMGTIMLISTIVSIIMIVSQWIIFKKAGKKGWEAIVPIYNFIVLIQVAGLPIWYIALFFVPFANIYAIFKIYIELAHKFGKSTGFGVLSVFFSFICLPILAFGKNNVYQGNTSQSIQNNNISTNHNNDMTNNISNSSTQQPFVFDQNINTNINNIQGQNINNSYNTQMNTIQQSEMNQVPLFNQPTTIVNQEPIVNAVPNQGIVLQTQNQVEPVNNLNNSINPMNENISTPEINQGAIFGQTPPVINQQQVFQEPVNKEMQPNAMPQLNVIPGMGPTPEPMMPNQNSNNQNI